MLTVSTFNATRKARSIPQENRRIDSQTEGRIIFSTILEGTSNKQYGGKNRVTAVLYCRPVRLRSVLRPAILALPLYSLRQRKTRAGSAIDAYMLLLSMKATR
jgi:hypothetical protein